jgi:hypothetical protein
MDIFNSMLYFTDIIFYFKVNTTLDTSSERYSAKTSVLKFVSEL